MGKEGLGKRSEGDEEIDGYKEGTTRRATGKGGTVRS